MTDKKYTYAGITKHGVGDVVVEKVRFSKDIFKVSKQYGMADSKKVWHTATGQVLPPMRCEYVELPNEMTKLEACQYLMTLPEFQSPEDQALIQETIGNKSPKDKKIRTPKIPKVRATVGTLMSKKKKSIDTYEKLITALAG
jgi:hypothetical protein